MNFISSVKDKMADRLKYDGSYEQIIKFYVYLRSPFAGGGRDKGAGSARMLVPALLLCGLFAALCLCWMVKGVLLSLRLDADIAAASRVSGRAPSFANAGGSGGLGDFTAANPFRADLPVKEENGASARAAALDSLSLQGTLPNIGAWIDGPDGTQLYLKGQNVSGYTLEKIKYGEVVLSDGKEEHSLYLFLSGGTAAKSAAPSSASSSAQQPSGPKLDFSGIEPAKEGQEGAVPRELVSNASSIHSTLAQVISSVASALLVGIMSSDTVRLMAAGASKADAYAAGFSRTLFIEIGLVLACLAGSVVFARIMHGRWVAKRGTGGVHGR